MFDEVSLASTVTSPEKTNVENVDEASIHISWSGASPLGAITVEASNSSDNDFQASNEVWEALDFGAPISISGASGSHQLILTAIPFRYLRLVYTATSGSGTLTAHIQATSVGN
jgi:hypothetical protein